MLVTKSVFYFILAGLCEIGAGYLVWLWLREGKSIMLAAVGAVVLERSQDPTADNNDTNSASWDRSFSIFE